MAIKLDSDLFSRFFCCFEGKGFTLQKKNDKNFTKVEIRKAENDSRTFYKVINSEQDIEIRTSKLIQNITYKLVTFKILNVSK